jgi:hypothetical protein
VSNLVSSGLINLIPSDFTPNVMFLFLLKPVIRIWRMSEFGEVEAAVSLLGLAYFKSKENL